MNLEPWLTFLVPLVGALFVPLVGRVSVKLCSWYAVLVSGVATVLCLHQALTFTSPSVVTLGDWSLFGGVQAEVYVDGLSVIMALFVSSLSLVILVYSAGIMSKESGQGRFYSLMLVFIGSMVGLVMAGNLVQFYLLWELLGICSALLIAFWWDREPARKAGLKAFLFTRVGDIALLIGVVLLLSTLHTTDINTVLASFSSEGGVNRTLIGLLFLIGAMGKSAQVPLHVWLPDAMEGPTPVSALIHAATMVNAGVFLLVRMAPLYAASSQLSDSVLAVGLVSMLVGGACASAATDIKRVLAYSTISQLGLMFAAIGVGAVAAAVYQLMAQGVAKALGFMSAGSASEATGTRDIRQMSGLGGAMKVTYAGFLVSALALAGFPPFFDFWTKELISKAAQGAGSWVFPVILFGSALTAFYMFRVIFRVFLGSPGRPGLREPGGLMVGPMVVLSAAALAGWAVVGLQQVYSPVLSVAIDPMTALVSTTAVAVTLAGCYFAFIPARARVLAWVSGSALLNGLVEALSVGVWFDAFYSALFTRVFVPISRLFSRLQTGDLGDNLALLLAVLVAAFLLVVFVLQ